MILAVSRPRAAAGRFAVLVALGGSMAACGGASDGDDDGNTCGNDADGLVGGDVAFELTLSESGVAPTILKSQNSANVTLTLTNAGTVPLGFAIDCINVAGCPDRACFPGGATSAPIAPGAKATLTFKTPAIEGIYPFHITNGDSDAGAATTATAGQFILQ